MGFTRGESICNNQVLKSVAGVKLGWYETRKIWKYKHPSDDYPDVGPNPEQDPKSPNYGMIFAIIAALVVIIAIAVIVILKRKKKTRRMAPQNNREIAINMHSMHNARPTIETSKNQEIVMNVCPTDNPDATEYCV